GSVHNGEMLLFPQWLERRHRWMQSEKTVEVKHRLPGDVNRRPHRVVTRLAVRHNDVQSVGRTALENDDQALGANPGVSGPKGRARQKARQRGRANYSQRTVAKKNPSSDGHREPAFRYSLFAFSGPIHNLRPEADSQERTANDEQLSPLKLRRPQNQSRNCRHIGRALG